MLQWRPCRWQKQPKHWPISVQEDKNQKLLQWTQDFQRASCLIHDGALDQQPQPQVVKICGGWCQGFLFPLVVLVGLPQQWTRQSSNRTKQHRNKGCTTSLPDHRAEQFLCFVLNCCDHCVSCPAAQTGSGHQAEHHAADTLDLILAATRRLSCPLFFLLFTAFITRV